MRDWAVGVPLGVGHACLLVAVCLRLLFGQGWATWLFDHTFSASAAKASARPLAAPHVLEVMAWHEHLPLWSSLAVLAALAVVTVVVRVVPGFPGVLALPVCAVTAVYGLLTALAMLNPIVAYWPLAAGLAVVSGIVLTVATRN